VHALGNLAPAYVAVLEFATVPAHHVSSNPLAGTSSSADGPGKAYVEHDLASRTPVRSWETGWSRRFC